MSARLIVKRTAQAIALAMAFPLALLCGFGRFGAMYTMGAHTMALAPGMIGSLLRAAFYKLTLRECSLDTSIAFGTFFASPDNSVGAHVSIGAYCVIGRAAIGRGSQIASHVGIPGGRHQHSRGTGGSFAAMMPGRTTIGEYCWIGESAIVMADVGAGSTIGAGAVVVQSIPPGVVAAGNPARIIRAAEGA
jgi:virginiamycin A acetyltransferase